MMDDNLVSVWNRATSPSSGAHLAPGDRALASLLLAHGMIMNGGVLNAVEVMATTEFENALGGYSFFGFAAVRELLLRAKSLIQNESQLEAYEAHFDSEYGRVIPDDSRIVAAFERHLNSNPSDFAPIE